MIAGAAVQKAADGGMGRGLIRRRAVQELEQRIEPRRGFAACRQMVIGECRIRRILHQPGESCDLIGQHLQCQPRVLFGSIHMPDLQAPVLIMLDHMVVRIVRKGHGIKPKRVYRGRPQTRQPRTICHQMRQIVPQDIVADEMCGPAAELLQPIHCGLQRRTLVDQCRLTPHRRKGKDPRRLRIDLQINRNASRKERGGVKGQASEFQVPSKASKSLITLLPGFDSLKFQQRVAFRHWQVLRAALPQNDRSERL